MNDSKERFEDEASEEKTSRKRNSRRGKGRKNTKGYSDKGRSGTRSRDNRGGADGASSNTGSDTRVPLHAANDFAWYAKSPEQVRNVANLSFLGAVGQPLTYGAESNLSAPGILRCGYIPTWGNPSMPSDPMNIAAFATFSAVRKANSGSRNYDYADLWQYLAVVDSAYAMGGFIARACAVLNAYSPFNQYTPKVLIQAMGLDFDDFVKNIAPFRTFVNNYASMVNIYAVPKALPIYSRHYWMCANIYADSQAPWSQLYINVPDVYARYNATTGNVDFLPFQAGVQDVDAFEPINANSLMTFDQLTDLCLSIVNSIYRIEDFALMSGDVLKAFGGEVFNIGGIAVDTVLYPVYDEQVLMQITNATTIGDIRYLSPNGVDPCYTLGENTNNGALVLGHKTDSTPGLNQYETIKGRFKVYAKAPFDYSAGLLLNLSSNNPTPEDVMEATRLIANVTPTLEPGSGKEKGYHYFELHECGADVYTTFRMYVYVTTGLNRVVNVSPHFGTLLSTIDDGVTLELISNLEHFDWHPRCYIHGSGDLPTHFELPFTDTHTVSIVDSKTIARIHEVANLSLFDVVYLQNYLKG